MTTWRGCESGETDCVEGGDDNGQTRDAGERSELTCDREESKVPLRGCHNGLVQGDKKDGKYCWLGQSGQVRQSCAMTRYERAHALPCCR